MVQECHLVSSGCQRKLMEVEGTLDGEALQCAHTRCWCACRRDRGVGCVNTEAEHTCTRVDPLKVCVTCVLR